MHFEGDSRCHNANTVKIFNHKVFIAESEDTDCVCAVVATETIVAVCALCRAVGHAHFN